MNVTVEAILNIVDEHSRKASSSDYDRGVAIQAIATARKKINAISVEMKPVEYKEKIIVTLVLLQSTYNDTDGQFTNGKGLLSALIDDIRIS